VQFITDITPILFLDFPALNFQHISGCLFEQSQNPSPKQMLHGI